MNAKINRSMLKLESEKYFDLKNKNEFSLLKCFENRIVVLNIRLEYVQTFII